MKKALITGITGQDGAYLAHLLSKKKYEIVGLIRNNANPNQLNKLKWIFNGQIPDCLRLEYSDMTDAASINRLVQDSKPDEIYNLAAQSHVGVSFKSPASTAHVNALGVLNILEACRNVGAKFYQASTSEMFGKVQQVPQNESTSFYPRSPYGVAKLFGYWLTVNYRESYNLFGCNGILFNHESPIRGENFVTKKITKGLVDVRAGKQNILELGNLDSWRDWGHAADYVEAMYLMLQENEPDDYVVSTGKQTSVRNFCEIAAKKLSLDLVWKGEGLDEIGWSNTLKKPIIKINERFYRPAEVDTLLGDSNKAQKILNWSPKRTLDDLVDEMIDYDINNS
jgi:GDPmannose 4,6-dehydratase